MRSLPLFHRIAGSRVIVLGEGAQAEARRRLVERAGGIVAGEDEPRARLAFVALDDPDAAVARLKARGILVNAADRPDLCDFTVPGIVDRDPVLIAIGTAGASAGLAKHLRLRLEGLLPPSLARLAEELRAARTGLRARFPGQEERRRALDAALAPGGLLDPLREESAAMVGQWLAGDAVAQAGGHVVITLASDDPDDLTLRQARLLGTADVLLIGPGVPEAVCRRARADALRRALPFEGELPAGLVVELRRG